MRIEHANITVTNLEASNAFYRDVLGFEIRWQGTATGEKGPVRAWHIGTAATYLALFETERNGAAPADYGVAGVNHICFEVAELQTYRARLAARGVPVHLEGDYEPGQRFYFYDPDGVEIELVCYRG